MLHMQQNICSPAKLSHQLTVKQWYDKERKKQTKIYQNIHESNVNTIPKAFKISNKLGEP